MMDETEKILRETLKKQFDALTTKGQKIGALQTEVFDNERTLRRLRESLISERVKYEEDYQVLLELLEVSGLADKIRDNGIGLGFLRGFPDYTEAPYSNSLILRLDHALQNSEETCDGTYASSEGSTEPTE